MPGRADDRDRPVNSALGRVYQSGDWRAPWLGVRAATSPEAVALVFEGRSFDYAELAARVEVVAQVFSDAGVARGDIVAVHLGNGLPMVEVVHAGFVADFVVQLVNTRLTGSEIEFQLRDSGARWFVHLAGDRDCEAVELEPGVERLCVRERHSAASISGKTTHNDPDLASGTRQIDLESPRFILYTSGTTGQPKGVALTGANLLASADGAAALLGADAEDRWLVCLPIFHIGGLSILLRSVLAGSAVVLHERFDPEAVDRDLERERITGISLVANMLARVLEVRGRRAKPQHLACVLVGGGPVPVPLREAAAQAGFPVAPTYGLTEAASQVATRPPGMPDDRGLVPLPGTEVQIMDEAGHVLGDDETGEICVRGDSVMDGYWQRLDATRDVLYDGWLHTGDVGAIDREGGLHVFDRRSDLIVSGGENIYPAEIEAVLLSHPAIAEAGVGGREDETYGARPVAWLVCFADQAPTAEELGAFCRARLAAYKCPVDYRFVEALPRNATGKLVRRRLGG
jgi:O-succinylbenzoic acid--CoA ligase